MQRKERGKRDASTVLERAREAMGFKRWRVADILGMDQTGLKRIETGKVRPTAASAETLYDFYGGILPLGLIFHPTHKSFDGWLTKTRERELRARARLLERLYPELAARA